MPASDHYVFMARYNRWFNARLYEAAGRLSDEERKRERGAFFGSIHGTLNHVMVGDRIWLRRFAGLAPAAAPGASEPSGQALRPPGGTQFTPRYMLHASATSNLGLRPRHAARGRWLYAVLGANRLAAMAAE